MNPHRTCQENMDALKKVLTQRTLLALSRRNVEFVLAHQADSNQQLADYLRQCRAEKGQSGTGEAGQAPAQGRTIAQLPGILPVLIHTKIQYAAFVATARPGEPRTRRSCSAEQGNRVQVPDMGPEPAGFRFRSCDCGALVRARRRALRKRVIGTAVMAGREGRTSALGVTP